MKYAFYIAITGALAAGFAGAALTGTRYQGLAERFAGPAFLALFGACLLAGVLGNLRSSGSAQVAALGTVSRQRRKWVYYGLLAGVGLFGLGLVAWGLVLALKGR